MKKKTNQTAQLRRQVVQKLEKISHLKCLKDSPAAQENIAAFIERAQDCSFCVAVVGAVSSGKSTFLNALLGQDLLIHGTQETTATITRLNNTDRADPRYGTCTVHYTDGRVQKFKNMDKLSQMSAVQYRQSAEQNEQFNASRDVAAVDLYPHFVDADMPVIFVDTPGLNGMADYHREKTIEQIRSAHACIYLLPVRGMSQFDVEFIRDLCRYQKDFIFVQNFADSLKEEGEGEVLEQKMQEQMELLRREAFDDQPDAHYRVCAVSARNALIAKDHRFTKVYDTDVEELNDRSREKLYQKSNFPSVLNEIQRLVVENQRGIRQLKSTAASAIIELSREYEFLKQLQTAEKNELESNALGRSISSLKEMEQNLQRLEKRNLEDLHNFWNSETSDNRSRQKQLIANEIQKVEKSVGNSIDACDNVDTITAYCDRNEMQKQLNKSIKASEALLLTEFHKSFEASLALAVTRIIEYTNWQKVTKKHLAEPKVDIAKLSVDDTADRDGIRRQEEERSKAQAAIAAAQANKERAEKNRDISDTKLKQAQHQRERENSNYSAAVKNHGNEPEVKREKKTRYEWRDGVIGDFLDWLCGPKEYTYWEEDTTARDEWRKKKIQMDNEHSQNICDLNSQISTYESRLEDAKSEIERCSDQMKTQRARYEQLEKAIQALIEKAEIERTKATQEYIQNVKKTLKRALKKYLYDPSTGLETVWNDAFRAAATKDNANGQKEIDRLYRESMANRLKELRQRIENGTKQQTVMYPDVDMFGKLLEELEEMIA